MSSASESAIFSKTAKNRVEKLGVNKDASVAAAHAAGHSVGDVEKYLHVRNYM